MGGVRHLLIRVAAAFAATTTPCASWAAPVVLISIDGLRPADVIEAEKRGVKAPTLRRFMAEGAYATGVKGVLPTLTYPSHTTIITGVSPARHGVVNNLTFDPLGINQTGWYWYAADIKAPTLWDAARQAKLRTANIHWPVSVGAPVDFNLPQIWRTGHDDDRKLLDVLATPGLVRRLEASLGAYAQGIDESVEGDENRARFAEKLIADERPDFTTVYFAGLDHIEHLHGPGTPEAHAALERIDFLVARVTATARKAAPDTVIVVVSDHGFAPVSTDVNLFRPFVEAGLIRLDKDGKVAGWDAEPWPAGGASAIILARPDDMALKGKVSALLAKLKADPANGIAAVIEQPDITKRGGAPEAAFFVNFAPGFETGRDPGAPLVGPAGRYKGMHGYFPDVPDMQAALFVLGSGTKGNLGVIDMRDIAPSIARTLGLSFPAEGNPRF